MKNKLTIEINEAKLQDEEARKFLLQQDEKLKTINERTKSHTKDIKLCLRKIKELGKKHEQLIKQMKELKE